MRYLSKTSHSAPEIAAILFSVAPRKMRYFVNICHWFEFRRYTGLAPLASLIDRIAIVENGNGEWSGYAIMIKCRFSEASDNHR